MTAVPSIAETDLDAFRAVARNWLEENFPASLREARGRPPLMNGEAATGDVAVWKARMAEKGWGAPTWPVEYGGGGLDNFQAAVLKAEMDAIGAFNPMAPGMGLSMVGPTILEYGTEAQKRRHIPPMVRG
jgi:alkylation response protein AidB-like acyl-CoA dehydrogenase